MMSKGHNVAVLISNGFNESEFIEMQKKMREMGISMKIISANQGLVNGWDGQGWGHNYAVDAPLNTALGADYDAVVIPGGERSHEKLKITAHTKRFVGSMMSANKPVIAMGDAVNFLADIEQIDGRSVTGPEESRQLATNAAATWTEEAISIDNMLMTGVWSEEFAAAMQEMMKSNMDGGNDMKAAA